MIEDIKNELLRFTNDKSEKIFFRHYSNLFIVYLIYLKYLCEIGTYSIDQVIMNLELYDIIEEVTMMKEELKNYFFPINSILRHYKDVKSSIMLSLFLDSFDRPIPFHGMETPIYIGVDRKNYAYYDETGHSIYIIGSNAKDDFYEIFQIFDTILGVKNQYVREDSLTLSNYHYLYIYDDTPKYLFIKNSNEYTKVKYYLPFIDHVILCTNYSKISNFQEGRIVLRYLNMVILSTIKAYMIFQKNLNGEISIINYDNEKISQERLLSIIRNNRKIKDILVKTNYQEIRDNNMRIGFRLYQLEKKKEIQDINKIVDENTDYLKRLNAINERVEREINRLLNK